MLPMARVAQVVLLGVELDHADLPCAALFHHARTHRRIVQIGRAEAQLALIVAYCPPTEAGLFIEFLSV